MSEIQVGQINSTDGSTAITTGADGYVSFAKTQIGGRRNLIINGAMQVWQRGTSASAATGYLSADRFFATSTSLNRSTDTPDGFAYSAQVSNSSGAAVLTQAVELTATGNSAPFYNGQSITLSFKAKVPVGTDNVQYRIRYCDIVNGSNPVVIQNTTSLGNGTGSWETYSDTITIGVNPAGTSKTLSVDIYLGGASDTSYLTGVQLEVGTVATPFEHRSFGEELALCQRYFCKSYGYSTVPGSSTFNGCVGRHGTASSSMFSTGEVFVSTRFAVEMRASPTVTAYDITGNANKTSRTAFQVADYHDEGVTVADISSSGCTFNSSSGTNAATLSQHYTADAEL